MSESVANEDKNPLHPWSGSVLPPLRVRTMGYGIIQNPLYNKGTAFSYPERDRLGLRGLLPPRRISMPLQMRQAMERMKALPTDIDRYACLTDICDTNETLFHALLVNHIEYLAPIVYTPTVGLACQQFGIRFSRPRGMYISALDRGQMHACMANWPHREVQVIVVTDGSRILGLGDLGAYGMGIPIGKLALYCAAGGIAPHRVLPVCLDVGTDNQALLHDPYYIGLVQNRLRGDAYFELVDEFLDAVRKRFPDVFVQFEDFSSDVAMDILKYYRDDLCEDSGRESVCVFNDDIQGTGAVTTAGLFSGLINRGESPENLKDQRIMICGAGSAGIGVATAILLALTKQGLSNEEAKKCFLIMDKDGALTNDRQSELNKEQRMFMRNDVPAEMDLLAAAEFFKPTILLGLSAVGGLFKEPLIRAVAKHCEKPFIFPLSNPTSSAECTAEQAYMWTDNKCIFASGSPFPPYVTPQGETKYASQCNNMFIFPGIGLAVAVCKIISVTDEMLYAAAVAVANSLTVEDRKEGRVYPQVNDIRNVSLEVACAVATVAIQSNLSKKFSEKDLPNLKKLIAGKMYNPLYVPLVHQQKNPGD